MGCGTSTSGSAHTKIDKVGLNTYNLGRQDPNAEREHEERPAHALDLRQQQLDNNPNFFYNEDLFVQAAIQRSIVESHGNHPLNENEAFNNVLKDTIVQSRKEYDDIDRKKYEEEILKIKDDPIAMKTKIESLMSIENVTKNNKKLPPLVLAQKNLNANKSKQKKDIRLLKAPILNNKMPFDAAFADPHDTNRQGNETESEIDIREDNNVHHQDFKPSYNPRLLKDEINEDQFNSLQSNDYNNNDSKFMKPDNNKTSDNMDLNELIAELNDSSEPMKSKAKNQPLVYHNKMTSHDLSKKQLISHDSFEDLMDDYGNPNQDMGISGAAKVHVINKQNW